jgi:hypothetical protein
MEHDTERPPHVCECDRFNPRSTQLMYTLGNAVCSEPLTS